MTASSAPRWWHDQNASLRSAAEDDPSFAAQIFSEQLLALLDEIEAAFAVTGAHTPGWEDPHFDAEADGERRDSLKEEYSRCLDPGKYRTLWARAEAWTRALTARGWADAADSDDSDDNDASEQLAWAIQPHAHRYRATVLRPRRSGALPLVLARTAPEDATGSIDISGRDALVLGLVVGIGEPAVPVSTTPDCGCDACDSGSRELLEDLDRTLLSIVDGSVEVTRTPHGHSMRTSFSAESGSGVDDPRSPCSSPLAPGPRTGRPARWARRSRRATPTGPRR